MLTMKMKKELMISEILRICEDGHRNVKELTENKDLCSNLLKDHLRATAINIIQDSKVKTGYNYFTEHLKKYYRKPGLIKLYEDLVKEVYLLILLNKKLTNLLNKQKVTTCNKSETCINAKSQCKHCNNCNRYTEKIIEKVNENPDNGLSEMGIEIKYDDFLKKAKHLKNLIENIKTVKVDTLKVNNEKIRSIMTYYESKLNCIKEKDWLKITVEWLRDCNNDLFESYDNRLNDDIQILTAYRDQLLKELDNINNDFEKVLKEDAKSWESNKDQEYYFNKVLIVWNKFNNQDLN